MMFAGRFVSFTLVLSLALLVGCPLPPGPDGNGGTPDTLSPQVQQAVDEVMARTQAVFQAVASFVDGVDISNDAMFEGCPDVDAQLLDGVVSIVLDYGDGCTNDVYGDATIRGRIVLTFNIIARSLSVQYEDFSIDDRTVTGSFILELDRVVGASRLFGSIDITTSDAGSIEGTLDVEVRLATVTITLSQADLMLTDESDTFEVSIDGVVIKPKEHANFIPEAGTISFEIADDDTPLESLAIVIAFDSESPVDGTVTITVGSAPPLEYQLPGF